MLQTINLPFTELQKRVNAGLIPGNVQVQVTYNDAAPAPQEAASNPDLTLFEQWAREDAELSPEELEADRRIFEQLEKNLNETRRECGMRTL